MMMFKVLLLQRLHNLSDDAMEYQLLDRLSFCRFVGCDNRHVPDAKTIWLYRDRLTKSGKERELFDQFYLSLAGEGLIAHRGQIVDASFVEAPKQRDSREENALIKSGEKPEGWNKAKSSQKDRDAHWTQKGGENYFSYKNHVCVDAKSKLIKDFEVTSASVHDSQILAQIYDTNEILPVLYNRLKKNRLLSKKSLHNYNYVNFLLLFNFFFFVITIFIATNDLFASTTDFLLN